MPNAMDVLNDRLARGEISTKDYDDIRTKLKDATDINPPPIPSTAGDVPPPIPGRNTHGDGTTFHKSKSVEWYVKYPGLFGVGALLTLVIIKSMGGFNGVNIGNITADGSSIRFTAANTNTSSENVLFWIVQNDIESCNRWINMSAGSTLNITMSCPQLKAGNFTLHRDLARNDAKRSSISAGIR